MALEARENVDCQLEPFFIFTGTRSAALPSSMRNGSICLLHSPVFSIGSCRQSLPTAPVLPCVLPHSADLTYALGNTQSFQENTLSSMLVEMRHFTHNICIKQAWN